jgi:hypothetical protein
MILLDLCTAEQAAEECRFWKESSPQRLKPDIISITYGRPEGRPLQRINFSQPLKPRLLQDSYVRLEGRTLHRIEVFRRLFVSLVKGSTTRSGTETVPWSIPGRAAPQSRRLNMSSWPE